MLRIGVLTIGLILLQFSGYCQTLNLSEEQRLAFKQRALEKTAMLSNYIVTLCDKNSPAANQDVAMDAAMDLFIDRNRIVEVSSKYSDLIEPVKIDRYLNRLRNYDYESVEIEWFDVAYASELKRGTDGKYYGTIVVFQKFIGRKGERTYEDVTQKNIEVVLEPRTKRIGDLLIEDWMVLLGDIQVVETK